MNKLGIFLRRHGPMILTAFGVAGTIVTAVVARADAKKEIDIFKNEQPKTKKEIAKCYAKSYWRTAITIAATSSCIIFSHTLDAKKIATLTAAATLVEEKFKKYRGVIKEKFGEEEEHNIYDQAVDVEEEWHISPQLPESGTGELLYFYDTFTEQFFKATAERVQQAMYHINRQFQLNHHVYLSEFQEYLGFKNITDLAKMIGWSDIEYLESGLTPWIDFYSLKKTGDNGIDYYVIYYDLEPSVGAMKDWM